MFKTILVPIDLAHPDRGASIVALAKSLGGEATRYKVLNVIEDIPAYVAAELPANYLNNARTEALSNLKELAEPLGEQAEAEVHSGHAASKILSTADAFGADLIIVGSHKPGFADYFIGSTAARVVRHAKCSVLVDR